MRGRLTLSFVALSLVLVLGVLLLRFYTVGGLFRDHETAELRRDAAMTAELIEQRLRLGEPVDDVWLGTLVGRLERLEYVAADGEEIVVEGEDYRGGSDEDLVASEPVVDGEVTLHESGDVIGLVIVNAPGSILILMALVGLLAAFMGYLVARLLSAPFLQLASAAEQLGRGRFDLDLPRTRIPEARAISQALQVSAGQLQERLAGEHAFAEHASHELRTPLTGLRLELEDLATREDLPEDARAAARRSVRQLETMDALTEELVLLSRRGTLVAGAEIPLRDLATLCAQSWADALAEQSRPLSAAVEGRLETTYTPGPVEHILDLLLTDVLRRGDGAVRMVFDAADDGHLRINVSAADANSAANGPDLDLPVTQARTVVAALGGRLEGDHPHDGFEVLLPRR